MEILFWMTGSLEFCRICWPPPIDAREPLEIPELEKQYWVKITKNTYTVTCLLNKLFNMIICMQLTTFDYMKGTATLYQFYFLKNPL
jgi:hypothetical protein